jgi:hypothetical protein
MNRKRIFISAAFGLFFVFAQAQEDYEKIFSADYEKALQFLDEEKWMNAMILSYGLKPKEVKAVGFPELIRYNFLQDKIETFAMESLYIQYGRHYANFSIGQFQIKPSFAENVEIDFLKLFGEQNTKIWKPSIRDTLQSQENRSARLKRLKTKKGMITYLCLFFKIIESKYPNWENDEKKIKFLASAYNSDYRKSKEEIKSFSQKKFFQTGLIFSKKYCYADISWFYFQQP